MRTLCSYDCRITSDHRVIYIVLVGEINWVVSSSSIMVLRIILVFLLLMEPFSKSLRSMIFQLLFFIIWIINLSVVLIPQRLMLCVRLSHILALSLSKVTNVLLRSHMRPYIITITAIIVNRNWFLLYWSCLTWIKIDIAIIYFYIFIFLTSLIVFLLFWSVDSVSIMIPFKCYFCLWTLLIAILALLKHNIVLRVHVVYL